MDLKRRVLSIIFSYWNRQVTSIYLACNTCFTSFQLKEISGGICLIISLIPPILPSKRLMTIPDGSDWKNRNEFLGRQYPYGILERKMTPLFIDMKLLADLGKDRYMFRQTFLYPRLLFLWATMNLIAFSLIALEVFSLLGKPIIFRSGPLLAGGIPVFARICLRSLTWSPDHVFNLGDPEEAMFFCSNFSFQKSESRHIGQTTILYQRDSFRQYRATPYTFYWAYLLIGLKYKIFEGQNMESIVDDHYGFKYCLNPLLLAFGNYVEEAIRADYRRRRRGTEGILQLWEVISGFFQTLIDSMNKEAKEAKRIRLLFEPALPVVWNLLYQTSNDDIWSIRFPICLQCDLSDNLIRSQARPWAFQWGQ